MELPKGKFYRSKGERIMSIFKRKEQEKNIIAEQENNAPVINEEVSEAFTLGQKIAEGRKKCGYTQEEFSELLGVTPQAVSKWENDVSCPDIQLLPKISQLLNISIDELLGNTQKKPEEPKAKTIDTSKLSFTINITKQNQNPVNVSLPFSTIKRFAKMGNGISGVLGNNTLNGVQLDEILNIVEDGATGEVFKVEAEDGTIVKFIIE